MLSKSLFRSFSAYSLALLMFSGLVQSLTAQEIGDDLPSEVYTLNSLSDVLVERLIKRTEQLESLTAKSENLEKQVMTLQSTSEALLTTLMETSKSRDDYKQKYESVSLATESVKASVTAEVERLKAEKAKAIDTGILIALAGAPAGVLVGGMSNGSTIEQSANATAVVMVLEALAYGGYKLYQLFKR